MANGGDRSGDQAGYPANYRESTLLGNEATIYGVSDSPEAIWEATGIVGYESRAYIDIPAFLPSKTKDDARFGFVVLRSVYQVGMPVANVAHACLNPPSEQLGYKLTEAEPGTNVVISWVDLERLKELNQAPARARSDAEALAEWEERSAIAGRAFYLQPGVQEPIGRDPQAHYAQQIHEAHMVPNSFGVRFDETNVSRKHFWIVTNDGMSVTVIDRSKHGTLVKSAG